MTTMAQELNTLVSIDAQMSALKEKRDEMIKEVDTKLEGVFEDFEAIHTERGQDILDWYEVHGKGDKSRTKAYEVESKGKTLVISYTVRVHKKGNSNGKV